MNMLKTSALLALLCLPLAAQAQYPQRSTSNSYGARYATLSYTFGELRLLGQDLDGGDDATGVRLGGSVLIHPDFFVAGALSTVGSGGYDADTFEIGLGYRHALSPRMDLVGIGGLVWVDLDNDNGPDDDDLGASLTGGARAALTDVIEVGAFLNYTQLFGDGDLALRGEGLYHFTPNFSAVAGLGLSDDVREASIGARWSFHPTR